MAAEPKPQPIDDLTPDQGDDRTRLAVVRTLQANQRTLLAWIRTAIALMAFGFVVARMGIWLRLASGAEAPGALRFTAFVGAGLVALGTAANTFAVGRFLSVRKAIRSGREIPDTSYAELTLGTSLAIAGGVLAAYLLLR